MRQQGAGFVPRGRGSGAVCDERAARAIAAGAAPRRAGEILAKSLDDAVLRDSAISDEKNILCFQRPAISASKFLQRFFWPNLAFPTGYRHKNLEMRFSRKFRRIPPCRASAFPSPTEWGGKAEMSRKYFFKT